MRQSAHRETLITYWNEKTYNRQNPDFVLIDPSTFATFLLNRWTMITIRQVNGRNN